MEVAELQVAHDGRFLPRSPFGAAAAAAETKKSPLGVGSNKEVSLLRLPDVWMGEINRQ